MRKLLALVLAVVATAAFAKTTRPVWAADSTITGLPSSSTPLAGTEVFPLVQSGSTKKAQVNQIPVFIGTSVISGSCTNGQFLYNNSGIVGCATSSTTIALPQAVTGATSGGIPFFSNSTTMNTSAVLAANQLIVGGGAGIAPATIGVVGTTTTVLHGNAAGAPTFGPVNLASDITGNLPVNNLNSGTSASNTTFWRGDGTWAVPAAAGTTLTANGNLTSGYTANQLVYSDGSKIQAGTVGAGLSFSGGNLTNTGVTSVATSCGASGGTITTTGTISASNTPTTIGTASPALDSYCGGTVILTYNGGATAPTLASAATNGAGWFTTVCNAAAAQSPALTPGAGTIAGAGTYTLKTGSLAAPTCVEVISDGTNYQVALASGDATKLNGNLSVNNLNSGTSASSSTFWRGDGTWATPAGASNPLTTSSSLSSPGANTISLSNTNFPTSVPASSLMVLGTSTGGVSNWASSLGTNGQAAMYADSNYGLVMVGVGSVANFTLGGPSTRVLTCTTGQCDVNTNFKFLTGGYILDGAGKGSYSTTAPTISSGFNTSGGSVAGANTLAFTVTVGTGAATNNGVLTMPTTSGAAWNCHVTNLTNPTTRTTLMTAHTATSVTVTNYDHSATTWVAQNFGNGDELAFVCGGY